MGGQAPQPWPPETTKSSVTESIVSEHRLLYTQYQCFQIQSLGTHSQFLFLLPLCSQPESPHFCSFPDPCLRTGLGNTALYNGSMKSNELTSPLCFVPINVLTDILKHHALPGACGPSVVRAEPEHVDLSMNTDSFQKVRNRGNLGCLLRESYL